MSTNALKCTTCKSWFIPVDGKMLCPTCDKEEVHRIGKDYERKFVENRLKEGEKV